MNERKKEKVLNRKKEIKVKNTDRKENNETGKIKTNKKRMKNKIIRNERNKKNYERKLKKKRN